MQETNELPVNTSCTSSNDDSLLLPMSASVHRCGAIRHIEDLGHEVDTLRAELRRCERQHSEDIRKLWVKLAVVIAAVTTILPTGWNYIIGMI